MDMNLTICIDQDSDGKITIEAWNNDKVYKTIPCSTSNMLEAKHQAVADLEEVYFAIQADMVQGLTF